VPALDHLPSLGDLAAPLPHELDELISRVEVGPASLLQALFGPLEQGPARTQPALPAGKALS
jgi:hypothetical protein